MSKEKKIKKTAKKIKWSSDDLCFANAKDFAAKGTSITCIPCSHTNRSKKNGVINMRHPFCAGA